MVEAQAVAAPKAKNVVVGGLFQVTWNVEQPGGALSRQGYHHWVVYWIVFEVTDNITIDDTTQLVSGNQSVYTPLGAVHRTEYLGRVPLPWSKYKLGVSGQRRYSPLRGHFHEIGRPMADFLSLMGKTHFISEYALLGVPKNCLGVAF